MDEQQQAQVQPVDVQMRKPFRGQGVLSVVIIGVVVLLAVVGALALVIYLSVR